MLIPQLRADGQRTEEPKTSPVRRKIRPCQRAVRFRNQRPSWIGVPPHGNVFSIRPERLWIGCTDECAESDTKDSAYHVSGREHDGVCAVLQRCFRHILRELMVGYQMLFSP